MNVNLKGNRSVLIVNLILHISLFVGLNIVVSVQKYTYNNYSIIVVMNLVAIIVSLILTTKLGSSSFFMSSSTSKKLLIMAGSLSPYILITMFNVFQAVMLRIIH